MIKSKKLKKFNNIKHGFFDSKGGVSSGIYKSLNCGIGSNDKIKKVTKKELMRLWIKEKLATQI